MKPDETFCFYCCLEKGRIGGCEFCGADAAGLDVERHPIYLPPGTVLDKQYLIGRILGHGGFGITYIGFDLNLRMRVAVKEYLPRDQASRSGDSLTVRPFSGGAGEDFKLGMDKFLEEGRALARFVDHPNIISVINYFEANGTAYIVMRYMEGMSLMEHLNAKGGNLPVEETVRIATMMLDGLRAVHGAGLLHRDVKPHNIFITQDGVARLIDFGSARRAMGEQTHSLTKVVSDGYAPFEQYIHNGNEGPWTDLYAVGATMYHCLAGRRPVSANERKMADSLKPLNSLPKSEIDKTLSDVVAKAMSLEPDGRFQNVDEMLGGLSGSLDLCESGDDKVDMEGFISHSDIKTDFFESIKQTAASDEHSHDDLINIEPNDFIIYEDAGQESEDIQVPGDPGNNAEPFKLALLSNASPGIAESPAEIKERERRQFVISQLSKFDSQILEVGVAGCVAKENYEAMIEESILSGVMRKEADFYIENFCQENRIKLFKDISYQEILFCTKCKTMALPDQNFCPRCFAPLKKSTKRRFLLRSWESSEIWLIAVVMVFIGVAVAIFWDNIFVKNKTTPRTSYTASELWEGLKNGQFYSMKDEIEVTGRVSKASEMRNEGFLAMTIYNSDSVNGGPQMCSNSGPCIFLDIKKSSKKANLPVGEKISVVCSGNFRKDWTGNLWMNRCYFP